MRFQKKTSVGNFLKSGEDFKDGDLIKIASEGKQEPGDFGMQNLFLVKNRAGKEGNLAFNQTSINNLIEAYGDDSIQWIGKIVKIWLIRQMVSGSMKNVVYLTHKDAELIEDAVGFRWVIPGAAPVAPAPKVAQPSKPADYPTDEINPDDIPF